MGDWEIGRLGEWEVGRRETGDGRWEVGDRLGFLIPRGIAARVAGGRAERPPPGLSIEAPGSPKGCQPATPTLGCVARLFQGGRSSPQIRSSRRRRESARSQQNIKTPSARHLPSSLPRPFASLEPSACAKFANSSTRALHLQGLCGTLPLHCKCGVLHINTVRQKNQN